MCTFCSDQEAGRRVTHCKLSRSAGFVSCVCSCRALPPLNFPLPCRLTFSTKSDAARALKLNKKSMGSRYIQVFEMSHQDWLNATRGMPAHYDMPIAAASVTCHVIKLKGLPFSARQADIVNFFAEGGYYITDMAVVMYVVPRRIILRGPPLCNFFRLPPNFPPDC
jgi:hypothetical protein